MKKVIFLCLLSLSFCLSKPADEQVAGKPAQSPNMTAVDPKSQMPPETSQASITTTPMHNTEQKPAVETASVKNNATESTPAPVPNEKKMNESQPTPTENKTKKDGEPQKETEKKVEPAKETETTTEPKASTDKKEKDMTPVKPGEMTEKASVPTTEKSAVTMKPTEAPKKDEEIPTLQARGFDGPSFIGGIILTLGLLAIGFMGFKYYKNHTERNYHTL